MILAPTGGADVAELAAALRPEDLYELALGSAPGLSPVEAIRAGVTASTLCETLRFNDGALAAIWGLVPGGTLGSIWMLCSTGVERRPSQFLRACPPLVERAHDTYHTLHCAPWRGNALHLRWLEWLGFQPGAKYGDFQIYSHVRSTNIRRPGAGDLGGRRGDAAERGQ